MERRGGFSLIELLIALALLAVITGLVVSNYDNIFGSAKPKVAELFVNETLKTPLMAYKLSVGNYPRTEEGLQALLKAPEGKEGRWRGPYIDKLPEDPWGEAYQYRCPGEKNPNGYDVWSLGADGKLSDDDIGNWQTER